MEFVYVVPRSDLFDLAFPHGFVPARDVAGSPFRPQAFLDAIRKRGYFVERRRAEQDSSIKQIIPYTVVTHHNSVLRLQRLTGGAEARLHGKGSVGVGGHINPKDGEKGVQVGAMAAIEPVAGKLVAAAAWRELTEEISIDVPRNVTLAGFINDDSNEVGSVHFGIVLVAQAVSDRFEVLEPDQLTAGFVSRDALLSDSPNLETWSSLVVEALFGSPS